MSLRNISKGRNMKKVLERAETLFYQKRPQGERCYYALGEGLGIKLFTAFDAANESFENQKRARRKLARSGLIVPQAYGVIEVAAPEGSLVEYGLVMDHIPSVSMDTYYGVKWDPRRDKAYPARQENKAQVQMQKANLTMLIRGIDHADIHGANIRKTKNGKTVVIDWDWTRFY
jgi:hypothetical protein